jgi:hypothetical protein
MIASGFSPEYEKICTQTLSNGLTADLGGTLCYIHALGEPISGGLSSGSGKFDMAEEKNEAAM